MANQPITIPKETQSLRPGTDERKSEWVPFLHAKKLYLLPIVARHQKLVPEFDDDGNVRVAIEQADNELAKVVEAFFELVATVKEKSVTISTTESLTQFFGLVRKLLLTNYDLSKDDLKHLLTMNNLELAQLFNSILIHVVRQ